jgi:hypothetical protein
MGSKIVAPATGDEDDFFGSIWLGGLHAGNKTKERTNRRTNKNPGGFHG